MRETFWFKTSGSGIFLSHFLLPQNNHRQFLFLFFSFIVHYTIAIEWLCTHPVSISRDTNNNNNSSFPQPIRMFTNSLACLPLVAVSVLLLLILFLKIEKSHGIYHHKKIIIFATENADAHTSNRHLVVNSMPEQLVWLKYVAIDFSEKL